jgi:hypothetical protein
MYTLDDTLDSGESVLEALHAKCPRAQDLDNALSFASANRGSECHHL